MDDWSTKKVINFQKILKKHHTGQLRKKGTILHQAPQITLFFYSPYIYIQDEVRTVEDEGLQVGEVVMDECSIKASFMTYPPNFFFW